MAGLCNYYFPRDAVGSVDYSKDINWAYCQNDLIGKESDVFYIAGTVYQGEKSNWENLYDTNRLVFYKAVNSDKGIYDDNARYFAPFYHQISNTALSKYNEVTHFAFENAYAEIRSAFRYYLANYNNGRPFIIAGYSQGAMMCLQLVKEMSAYPEVMQKMVACYAIGWRVTEQDLEAFPNLKMAEGESDTGVIISFNSEAPDVQASIFVPAGVKSLSINPLNWKTDSTVADKSLNKGICSLSGWGLSVKDIQQRVGAYLDPERGTLKVLDLQGTALVKQMSEDGVYHGQDTQLFYRNLEENVQTRIAAYLEK